MNRLFKINHQLVSNKRFFFIFGLITLFLTINLLEMYAQNEESMPMFLWLSSIFQDYYFALYAFPILFILLLMGYPEDLTSNPLLIGRLGHRKWLVRLELLIISKLAIGFILTIGISSVVIGMFQFKQSWSWIEINQRLYFMWTATEPVTTILPAIYIMTILLMTVFYYLFLGLVFRIGSQVTRNRGIGMLLIVMLIGIQGFVSKSGIRGFLWELMPSAHYLNYFSNITAEGYITKLTHSCVYWLVLLGSCVLFLHYHLIKKDIRR